MLLVGGVGFAPAASGATAQGRAGAISLRVVTLNLLHGGPWSSFTGDDRHLEARLRMIVEELRGLRPDVVGLQESPASRPHGHVAARLAAALGLHWAYAPATERVFPFTFLGRLAVALIGFTEGPALLSRFPIAQAETHDLPRCRRWLDPRVVLEAEVDSPAGPLVVFSTHTSRDDCQVRRVAEIVRARGGDPALLLGDLNTADTSPVIAALSADGFVDAFRIANPDAAGHTVWQRIEAPAPTVFRRVDYIFAVSGRDGVPEVRASRLVLNAPRRREDGTVLWPSDHYGVLADIDLLPR